MGCVPHLQRLVGFEHLCHKDTRRWSVSPLRSRGRDLSFNKFMVFCDASTKVCVVYIMPQYCTSGTLAHVGTLSAHLLCTPHPSLGHLTPGCNAPHATSPREPPWVLSACLKARESLCSVLYNKNTKSFLLIFTLFKKMVPDHRLVPEYGSTDH